MCTTKIATHLRCTTYLTPWLEIGLSVIVHHVKIEIDLSEDDFFYKLFVCILSNLIHGLWVHFTSKGVQGFLLYII
jgi:hypothetical protein